MEHFEDGRKNPEGAKRRKLMKKLYLGITYGMGYKLLSEELGCSVDEAKQIIKNFYDGFPKVKNWMDETRKFAFTNGYVTDYWGRRRRLPDMLKSEYEVISSKSAFNPLFNVTITTCNNLQEINRYQSMLKDCKSFKERKKVQQEIEGKGFKVIDNTNKISLAERQCINARIQGSAATMTKKAMILIYNDKELNDLGFKLLIGVHDELIGECPTETSEAVAERLSHIMKLAGGQMRVPFKCDAEIENKWYYNEISAKLREEYKKLLEKSSETQAFNQLLNNHTEFLREELNAIIS